MTKKVLLKFSSTFILFVALFAFFKGVSIYNRVYKANIKTPDKKPAYIFIPTGSDFNKVNNILEEKLTIINKESFLWVCNKKNYPNKIKPGKYKIRNNINNNELVNMLRAGWQEPVMVTFNNVRLPHELAQRISKQIEASDSSILQILNDNNIHEKYNFTKETFPAMFIPNTYEFFWNTSAEEFIERMHKEYLGFWNESRLEKAKEIGLSAIQVSVLASIVDQETHKNDEKARIAGLYLNRLNRNIRLHADPTIKFAIGDFGIKRVLRKHLQINSPYNTYRNDGLPPGPICYPSIKGIDAVLNYENHNYLYMCAKEDFSGYHNFATNLREHNENAARYRRALNKRKIYK